MRREFMIKISDLLRRREVARLIDYPGHRISHLSSKGENRMAVHMKKQRLNHCLRVAYISYMLARVLRINTTISARAGLLHDCGFNPEIREPTAVRILRHPLRGALIARKLGEPEEVVTAVYSHMFPLNHRHPPASGVSFIVWLADKIDAFLEYVYLSTLLDKRLNQPGTVT